MSKDELARWLCLIEGVNIIFDKYEEMHEEGEIDIIKDRGMLSAIHKGLANYITDREHAMRYDLDCYLENEANGNDYFMGLF